MNGWTDDGQGAPRSLPGEARVAREATRRKDIDEGPREEQE